MALSNFVEGASVYHSAFKPDCAVQRAVPNRIQFDMANATQPTGRGEDRTESDNVCMTCMHIMQRILVRHCELFRNEINFDPVKQIGIRFRSVCGVCVHIARIGCVQERNIRRANICSDGIDFLSVAHTHTGSGVNMTLLGAMRALSQQIR